MLFRNTVAATVALVTGYVCSFIVAPIMLARLGLAQFGVWAVTGAFATYAGLMDLGITRALGRFVAFYNARGDRRSVEQLFTLGLLAVTVVGAVAGLAAVLAAPLVAHALDDVLSPGDMRLVLCSSVAIGVLNTSRSVMRSVPEGMERFVPPNVAEIAFNVTNFAFSLVALAVSRDLVVYAVANVAAGLLGISYAAISIRCVAGDLALRVPPRPLVRETLAFSVQNQLSWVADLSAGQAAKIVIALFVDVRAAGAFEIASRAVIAAKSLAVMSVAAMVPTATARIVAEGAAAVPPFYRRYTVRSLAVSYPLMVFLCAAAPALLVTWLGEVPNDSLGAFIVLTAANCVNLSTGVSYTLALAEGRARAIAIVSAVTAGLVIGSMLVLAPFFGLWGVVAGSAFGTVVGATVWNVVFHRSRGIPAGDYVRSVGRPLAAALLAAVPIILSWAVLDAPADRGGGLVVTLADLAVFLAIYLPLAGRLDLLPQQLRPRSLARTITRRPAASTP